MRVTSTIVIGTYLSILPALGQSNFVDPKITARTPPELIEKAGAMFPDPLAKQVQELVGRDLQKALVEGAADHQQERSVATFFLADRFYDRLGTGHFEGVPAVIWNGYDPEADRPAFIYERSNFAYVTASGRRIVPGTMDTDGGSIPKIIHSVGAFTPWGYGPAYIIHDWLFVAHKCATQPDADISFEDSASILAEAIKTLIERGFLNYDRSTQTFPKKEDTLYLIYQAVHSDIARNLWNDTGNVRCRHNASVAPK